MIKLGFSNLKRREKVLAIMALVVCGFLLINKLFIGPTFKSLSEVSEKYKSKNLLLSKYYNFISNEKWYSEKLRSFEDEYNILEGKILNFETEELASAKLQELAKNIARSNGLSISRSIAAKKRVITEDPHLVSISANFEINDVNQLKKLRTFLYDLEYNKENLFFVNDIKVKGIGLEKVEGISISTTLAVIASISKR